MKFLIILLLLISCNGGYFGKNKHVIPGIVVNVGRGHGGVGFFGGNYRCAVEAVFNGKTQYITVLGDVVKGQTIYKYCWSEGEWIFCFADAYKSDDWGKGD